MPDMTEEKPQSDLASMLREVVAASTPTPHSPVLDDLVALIEEELGAQIAMQRLGKILPSPRGTDDVALVIADVVDLVYRLERRAPPGSDA